MIDEARDLLLDTRPAVRRVGISLLLASGWSPAAILAEVPYLAHDGLLRDGDASRDVRCIVSPREHDRSSN